MTVNYTALLALGQPVTGTESGAWGDDVNNAVTSYLDIAIAGTLALTSADFTAGALTISNTQGTSSATNISGTTAQYAILKVSSLATNSTITAPSTSKTYLVVNADATYTVTVKASGQTGYTVSPGTRAWVVFNGTDYVLASTNDVSKLTGFGTGVAAALAVNVGTAGAFVVNGGALGTPSSGTLTSCTGLPVSTGVSGLGTGVASALAVNTGSAGAFVVNGGALGTPSSGTLSSCTGLPVSTGVSGLGTGVATALAVNTGTAGAFVVNGGALGTPSSGTVTNLTGTASININGTVGATTPTTGAFTTVSASGVATFSAGTAAAPAITTSGDTNNGIYFPAADNVAITTGGTQRLLVDQFGSVGIGTSSPAVPLHVVGADATTQFRAGTSAAYFRVAAADSVYATSCLVDGASAVAAGFGSATNIPTNFYTNNTERVTIDTSGNVGVGTNSPGVKLDVLGTTGIRAIAAATQDAVIVKGRAGGTSSYAATITPATLSANRTVTIPDETFTVGFRNIPAVGTKTSSYTLAVGDVGKYVQVGTSGSITIPDATFAEGDVISIFNNTTGNITITCSITTAYIAGTDSDKATMTLATRGVATVLFISSTVCVVSGNVS